MKKTNYSLVAQQLSALIAGIPYEVANLANASALLWQTERADSAGIDNRIKLINRVHKLGESSLCTLYVF
jgi:putative methionine-R-sulfoxide reductase with GAF domain